jgi:hypothetical protein
MVLRQTPTMERVCASASRVGAVPYESTSLAARRVDAYTTASFRIQNAPRVVVFAVIGRAPTSLRVVVSGWESLVAQSTSSHVRQRLASGSEVRW